MMLQRFGFMMAIGSSGIGRVAAVVMALVLGASAWAEAGPKSKGEPKRPKKTAPKPSPPPKAKTPKTLRTFVTLADWTRFGYTLGPKAKTHDFDFRFDLTPKPPSKSLRARAAFNVVDKAHYYFVEFSSKEIYIGRAEAGIEQRIGTCWPKGIGSAKPHHVIIKRRENNVAVLMDGRLIAVAYDDTFSSGRVALGAVKGSAAFSKAKVQSAGELYFADDFMRTGAEGGEWDAVSGHWEIYALDNPTRSINAFAYVGRARGKPALATAGHWFWSDYEFSVSFKSSGRGKAGVYFYYVDPRNYVRLTWGSNDAPKAQRRIELTRVVNGKATVLASRPGGFRPGQWYRIRIVALSPYVTASIDESPVFRIKDDWLCSGRIGLYAATKNDTYFDDVLVQRARGFFDDFTQAAPATWTPLGGRWAIRPSPAQKGNSVMAVQARSAAKLISGCESGDRYSFSAEAAGVGKGRVGLVFAYRDESSYGLLRVRAKGAAVGEIVHVLNGQEHVLGTRALPKATGVLRLRVEVEDGLARGYVGTVNIGDAWREAFLDGKVGLYAEQTEATFDNAQVVFRSRELQPVFSSHRVFSEETTMANWAAAQSDWYVVKAAAQEVTWHRGSFPDDIAVEIKLPNNVPAKGKLTVCLNAPEEKMQAGYELIATSGETWALELRRAGATCAKKMLPKDHAPKTLRFRRIGSHVLAYVDRRVVLGWRDPHPLAGEHLGWSAEEMGISNEDVAVYSERILTDEFAKAPVEWRVGAGIWEVTNRWQCDPRWEFFSGRRDDGPAVLWHKRAFQGDLTVEFAAAIKMDYTKSYGYKFASDLNATLCADGRNIDSGYSFVFGGWGNTKTAIVRQRKVVAEAAKPIIDGYIHRRWWYFKIEKRGNRLRYWVDNKLVLEYADPKPLAGNRIAIWTYRHGMMLARFRVSCTGPMVPEPYDINPPSDCRCFYDAKK